MEFWKKRLLLILIGSYLDGGMRHRKYV